MEAPEKIYLNKHPFTGELHDKWLQNKLDDSDIEYIRKDVFIDKAWNWIEDNILSSNQQDKSRLYFKQFKNSLKGE